MSIKKYDPPALIAVGKRLSRLANGLVVVRALYFFYFAGIGAFFPFINVYYRNIGLSGVQIGLMSTLAPLIGIISMMLWGILNDWFGRTRLLLRASILGAILFAQGISAVTSYGWLLVLVCSFSFFASTLAPLLDSICLTMLGDRRERYGTLRVWGTYGFVLTSSSTGFLYERAGLHTLFLVYAAVMAFLLISASALPRQAIHIGGSPFGGLSQMVRRPLWVVFALSTFVTWLAVSGLITFIGVTIVTMGGSDSLVGLSWTAAASAEIPIMLFGSWLLRKTGAVRLVILAFLAYALRMYLYSVMPSPGWVPVINLLQSVTFATFWIGAVSYISDLAPENLKTTAQGLLFSMMNLATLVGGLWSGWLFDTVGPRGLFRVLSIFCILALLLFSAGQIILKRRPHETLPVVVH